METPHTREVQRQKGKRGIYDVSKIGIRHLGASEWRQIIHRSIEEQMFSHSMFALPYR